MAQAIDSWPLAEPGGLIDFEASVDGMPYDVLGPRERAEWVGVTNRSGARGYIFLAIITELKLSCLPLPTSELRRSEIDHELAGERISFIIAKNTR